MQYVSQVQQNIKTQDWLFVGCILEVKEKERFTKSTSQTLAEITIITNSCNHSLSVVNIKTKQNPQIETGTHVVFLADVVSCLVVLTLEVLVAWMKFR